ncbi:amiloride-sensitive sodium channel subunit beta-like [Elysia marginata]|uniref:Amiloride-sensitive sodium channel subunit beta-like n=1 Tax=Elysia marginata TaxID=1093978 RepID=A0AAV4GBD9_9GAST|nr:amiloride-sensitive sodium channel subunit beta-like [Elysia marginata]
MPEHSIYADLEKLALNLSDLRLQDMGHQIEDMVISCTFNTVECSAENFTHFYNYRYGNCFTFTTNDEKNGDNTGIGVQAGQTHGLVLEMNVQSGEYMAVTESAGLLLLVHEPDRVVYPDDGGLVISPGFATNVALQKVRGQCVILV